MKWVFHCLKIIEKDNFIEVLEEGMENDEYHAWRRVMDCRIINNKAKTNPTGQIQGLLD